jgi:hypothetical protein
MKEDWTPIYLDAGTSWAAIVLAGIAVAALVIGILIAAGVIAL